MKSLLCGVESAQNVMKCAVEEQSSETDTKNTTCVLDGIDRHLVEETNVLTINGSVDNILNSNTFNESKDVDLVFFQSVFSYKESFLQF